LRRVDGRACHTARHDLALDPPRSRRGRRPPLRPRLQPTRPPAERGQHGLVEHRRAAEAAERPDPEPRRGRQGLRGARARHVRGGHRGARRGAGRTFARRGGPGRGDPELALGRLFAVAEAYPELQADENFRQLQEELATTENRIAVSRQVYNDTVLTYNTAIQQVPGNLFAGPFGFTRKDFFEVEDEAREAPRVAF